MAKEPDRAELPDGLGAGILFGLVIVLAIGTGVAQLVIAKQYVTTGLVIILISALVTLFLIRAGHSPRAGENSSEEQK